MNRFARRLTLPLCLAFLGACANTPPVERARIASATSTRSPSVAHTLSTATTEKVIALPSMQASRAAHTTTLLPDGNVLITGGFSGDEQSLASVELFDTARRSFVPGARMRAARSSHTATLLPNGKVLIAGGYDGTYLSSAELYDPATGKLSSTGQMSVARSGHGAVLLDTGKVLLVGGVGTGWTFLASAELYDPATETFTPTGAMTTPRESHTATLLQNGNVLVIGGHQGRRSAITIYASAEVYDPATGAFTPTGNLTLPRHKHDATLLPDGRVLVSGGADRRDDQGAYTSTEIYELKTGKFTAAGKMHVARYKHQGTSVVLPDGKVLLMGGARVAELFDPATNTFSIAADSIGATRLFAATARLANGAVLLTGGYGPDITASAQAWLFTP